MPKIFINFFLIIIITSPYFLLSQEVLVNQLPQEINTNDSEINFIQINDSTAYYTVIHQNKNKMKSNIYTTSFVEGNWSKRKKNIYNANFFNTGNISFSDKEGSFFTICNDDMSECKIVYLEKNKTDVFKEITELSSNYYFNTQGSFFQDNEQKMLYFVSDRKGGFGGLDIWVSIIDNNGNFGVPINAGNNINSSNDEITPFYNKHDGMMYFSSNKKNGLGGFDIYKSEGKLNFWKEAKNVKELNTKKDEMYLTFYNERKGYLSSNRNSLNCKNEENCCNDIFSFEYKKDISDTIKLPTKPYEYLPLSLYFHNDEPDCCTMSITTKKTYKEAYVSYVILKSDYENKNKDLSSFFKEELQTNFNVLNILFADLLFDLLNGKNIELQIRGYASPLHESKYNKNLSKRRIASFINYLDEFNRGVLKGYRLSNQLIIKELSLGESTSSEKVSDDINDKQKSIYSIEAMMERKIEIVDVILKE